MVAQRAAIRSLKVDGRGAGSVIAERNGIVDEDMLCSGRRAMRASVSASTWSYINLYMNICADETGQCQEARETATVYKTAMAMAMEMEMAMATVTDGDARLSRVVTV